MLTSAATYLAYVSASSIKSRLPSALQATISRFNGVVLAVLAVFVYLYVVDVTCVIVPWLSYSVPGVLNLLVLSGCTATALYCYFCCMFWDPGTVPAGWAPDEEHASIALQEVKRKDGAPRFCQKCNQYKPPRSHHCRVCKRCVLRMDHHCVFVNNCIGHRTYKAFFLLVLYSSAAAVHTVGLLISHTLHVVHVGRNSQVLRAGPHAKPLELGSASSLRSVWAYALLQTLAVAVSLPAAIALLMLLGWHVRMMLENKSTIEYQEGVTAQLMALSVAMPAGGRKRQRHPYDLGVLSNLHQVLGESGALWCVPPRRGTPGGLRYPTYLDGGARDDPWAPQH